jgi:hypothetical protein
MFCFLGEGQGRGRAQLSAVSFQRSARKNPSPKCSAFGEGQGHRRELRKCDRGSAPLSKNLYFSFWGEAGEGCPAQNRSEFTGAARTSVHGVLSSSPRRDRVRGDMGVPGAASTRRIEGRYPDLHSLLSLLAMGRRHRCLTGKRRCIRKCTLPRFDYPSSSLITDRLITD